MISTGMIATVNFEDKQLEQCRVKRDIEENLDVSEEIIVNTNGYFLDKIESKDVTMYFEENLEPCDKVTVDYKESIVSVPLTEGLMDEKWNCETIAESSLRESKMDEQENDEETIATFVTAEGQQLALYAVEGYDDIFAVAVYDESGEPPTNFEFLMKADVERLINEGAVRTVKKPSQIKKRLITTQPPVLYHNGDCEEINERANDKIFTRNTSIDNSEKSIVQEEDCGLVHDYKTCQNYNDSIKNNSASDRIHITADEQSDITYFMMDNDSINIAEQSDENQNNAESEDELMERSTVQYILLEGDHQSDSELTFDEIQATLQNLKTSREKASKNGDKKFSKLRDDESISFSQDVMHDSSSIEPSNEDMDELDLYMSSNNCGSVTEDDRQRLIDTLTDSPPSTTMTASTPQPQLKIKRSRKQQLISVNRDDAEIIIQPASMLSEEEQTNKKRGRRRRRLSTQMRVTMPNTKRIKRKRREVVEVIDLDADEEEKQPKDNVVEITLDDSKDKYSSDKENEIIMVRDSDSDNGDDEEEEEDDDDEDDDDDDDEESADDLTKLNGMIRCEHCSKNFRHRRAFDTHLRICQKSSANALRLDERKSKDKKESQKVRKQYACKICQEKFDVVVVLARHVRTAHSQRKKHRIQNKSWRSIQQKEITLTEEEEKELSNDDDTSKSELSMLARVKRKRKQRSNYSWEKKELKCADCGRWFPSSAMLDAHSLQHGTKKSEQLRRCHVCKKLIKSRMLFLQHLKVHSDTPRMLRRRLRARPSARKIASPRKRGRPRKF
ncbi:glutamic acid-rich protein isoform X2 [Camponotus floridanus]|nr:glutamic acid-rich protein isoform X2 [Camponotus floridanus]